MAALPRHRYSSRSSRSGISILHLMLTTSGNLQNRNSDLRKCRHLGRISRRRLSHGSYLCGADARPRTRHRRATLELFRTRRQSPGLAIATGIFLDRHAIQTPGMDATDSFQPGQPVILPDVDSLDEIVARSGLAQATSTAYGSEPGLFPSQPAAAWHGAFSTNDTGAALTSSTCCRPPIAVRRTESSVSLVHARCRGGRRRACEVGRSIRFARRPRVLADRSYRRAWK